MAKAAKVPVKAHKWVGLILGGGNVDWLCANDDIDEVRRALAEYVEKAPEQPDATMIVAAQDWHWYA